MAPFIAEVHSDVGYISNVVASTYKRHNYGSARLVEMPISGYIEINRSIDDKYKGYSVPVCHGLPDFLVSSDPNSYVVVEATTRPIGLKETNIYLQKKLLSMSYYLDRQIHARTQDFPNFTSMMFLIADRDGTVDRSTIEKEIYNQWNMVDRGKHEYSFGVDIIQIERSFRMLEDAVLSELGEAIARPRNQQTQS